MTCCPIKRKESWYSVDIYDSLMNIWMVWFVAWRHHEVAWVSWELLLIVNHCCRWQFYWWNINGTWVPTAVFQFKSVTGFHCTWNLAKENADLEFKCPCPVPVCASHYIWITHEKYTGYQLIFEKPNSCSTTFNDVLSVFPCNHLDFKIASLFPNPNKKCINIYLCLICPSIHFLNICLSLSESRWAGPDPSYHWARGREHAGQVCSCLQGWRIRAN